jgi:GNAT superfamily N-acetyltransferase
MTIVVREARRDDGERMLDAYEWLFAPPGRTPPGWDREAAGARLGEAIGASTAAVFVATEGQDVAGLCTAYIDLESVRFGRRCWVEDLAVHPDHRSRGIGGELLDAAAEWARGQGATHLELDTGLARTDAQRFYERREPTTLGYSYSWVL